MRSFPITRMIEEFDKVEGSAYFQKMHHDRYWEVYRMVSLKKTHYMRFLAGVSVQMHDKFCDCGKIETIQEKE